MPPNEYENQEPSGFDPSTPDPNGPGYPPQNPAPPNPEPQPAPQDYAGRVYQPEQQAQAPGVYTREEGKSPQEIDMLWSSAKLQHKEDLSPIVFFFIGFVVGALLTGIIMFLLLKQPNIETGDTNLIDDSIEQTEMAPKVPAEGSAPAAAEQNKDAQPAKKSEAKPTNNGSNPKVNITTHTVRSGDTLERIARQYYGSGSPANIDKLQRANNMNNPNALQIDQKLVIPPKNI